jgi:hypothetical protein
LVHFQDGFFILDDKLVLIVDKTPQYLSTWALVECPYATVINSPQNDPSESLSGKEDIFYDLSLEVMYLYFYSTLLITQASPNSVIEFVGDYKRV